ncbi:MAG: efflux RND transporter periplasmic adaptor subunit [Candidatus Omnitrophica bacterium]|nr:efflux RND transporter periplasmic adaptor subunit [Candidatus Omnitrophota bacterium]
MNASPNKAQVSLLNRRSIWLAAAAIVVIVGISYATINTRLQTESSQDQPIFEVQKGSLTVSIPVSGTIQARNKEIIKNELEGSSTIIYLIPEGTRVKEGELLIELDASQLIDDRVEQNIKVQNAEAAYIQARENLAIETNQAQSDIELAQLTYDFAVQDLVKYEEGTYPTDLKDMQSNVSTIQEELELARQDLGWSKTLYEEKYLSLSEYQSDQLKVYKSEQSLEVAKAKLELLKTYDYKRQIAQLESDISQAEMALDRTKRQANANIVQASADLQAKLAEYEQQQSKLSKLDDQISKAKIYAPMDGLVVYATSVRMSFRGNEEPLDEGQQVRERQELIHLPTTSSFVVDAKVPESSLEKIRLGLPVRITVDAVPGKVFTGKVSTIAPLPNAQSIFMNPDLKVYDTQILIDGNGDDLRSGMGCQAEIIVDYFEDTMYVPVQAVLRIGGKPTVFVAKGDEWEQREVDLGPDNNRLAQIKSGLKEGEVVWLTPPLAAAEISDDERFRESNDITKIIEDANNNQNLNLPVQTPRRSETAPQNMDGARRGGRTGEGRSNRPNMDQQGSMGQGGPGGGRPGGNRPDFQNMTPEQRQQMQQRFQNMSQEERDSMRRRFQQDRNQSQQDGGQ